MKLSAFLFLVSITVFATPARKEKGLKFPTKIQCGQSLFYTRLGNLKPPVKLPKAEDGELTVWSSESKETQPDSRPKAGEVAVDWDFFAATINVTQYVYSVWNCDGSEAYTFKTTDIAIDRSAPEKSKKLKGKASIEVRGETSDFYLDCEASY